jgi:phage-related baseplate assembly protein
MNTHDFTATLQFGIVSAVDENGHNLRVKIPALEDLETDWLPMITPAAGGNQFYSLPEEGEQVVCLLDARGENGCVIGSIYSTADKPPASNKDKWIRRFKNGTVIEHDRQTAEVLVKTKGVVTIDADMVVKKTLTVEGLFTYTAGMLGKGGDGASAVIDGSLVTTEDVTAGGISVKGHIHDGDSGGKTSSPLT